MKIPQLIPHSMVKGKVVPIGSQAWQDVSLPPLLFNKAWEALARAIRWEKEIRSNQAGKE